MEGAHRFIETRLDAADRKRAELVLDEAKCETLRSDLRTILGVVDARLTTRLEQFGDTRNPALVSQSKTAGVYQVRWPVLENVWGEGLWVQQHENPRGYCVVVPDADQTPEQLLGLSAGLPPEQIAARLAAQGLDLLIPSIISRDALQTDDVRTRQAGLTQREWIYRQAFHMGRHVIGYDLQRILGAVDWFAQARSPQTKIGIVGYGEGGLLAMHAAAIDPRIDAALISGYFNSSHALWSEPIYRSVWQRSLALGNAEVASLIAPRVLLIEHSEFPLVTAHKGEIATPQPESVRAEFQRIRPQKDTPTARFIAGDNDTTLARWSAASMAEFSQSLGIMEPEGLTA
ncbi:MAG: dienelactone hydrolase family protein, partial [Proteobacteria bacterium]|nr:dienelactone hydrolase family protein [Pseudomonadota bacterium]